MGQNKIIKNLFFALLTVALISALGSCTKKKPTPPPQPTPKPRIQKISLPVSQLMGLNINGKKIQEIAAKSPDPQVLDAQDLGQFFEIQNPKYLEHALKIIENQLQSGAPLKNISVFLGGLSKKYAAQCLEDLDEERCLIEPVAFNCSEALPQKNWSEENYSKLCPRIGRLKAFKPNYLVALFDGDNTLWYQDLGDAGVKQGVDSKRIQWDDGKAELMQVFPIPAERAGYKTQKSPLDYYNELYEAVGPLWNYAFGALAFRGLSLKAVHENFQEISGKPFAPTSFEEMSDLIKYLNDQGIVTGVVSASPVFAVIPMVESLQTGIPLDRIEGLDVFIKNPQEPTSLPVRLSRLINQGRLDAMGQAKKYDNYQEVLADYGDWIIVDVDHVLNARGGKGVQSRSIARRFVADQNRQAQNPNDRLEIDDLRLVLIGGDNFGRPTDIQAAQGDRILNALELGNDQGIVEGLPFLEADPHFPGGTDLLFIRRYSLDLDNKVSPKAGKLEKFQEFLQQQKLIRPTRVGEVLVQGAITDIKAVGGQGGFLKEEPQTPETQASPTGTPETQPKPGAETQATSPQPETQASPTAPSTTQTPSPAASPTPTMPSPTPKTPTKSPTQAEPFPPAPPPKLDALP